MMALTVTIFFCRCTSELDPVDVEDLSSTTDMLLPLVIALLSKKTRGQFYLIKKFPIRYLKHQEEFFLLAKVGLYLAS